MNIRKSITSFAVALVAAGFGLSSGGHQAAASTTADGDLLWVVYELIGPDFEANINIAIDTGDKTATFTFTNESMGDAAGSQIEDIYFESGLATKLASPKIISETDVNFAIDVTAPFPKPPSHPNVPDIPWDETAFYVFASPPPTTNGITSDGSGNPTDTLVIEFSLVQAYLDLFLSAGALLADLLGMIQDEDMNFRIVAHVLNCNNSDSCTVYANPIPPAIWLFVSALMGLGGLGYRRRRAAAA